MKRLHIFISGKVQGVFFRSFTKKEAEIIGLTGWTKNLYDGRVEVLTEGDSNKLDKFLEKLKKGSPQSRVDKLEFYEEKYLGEFTDFSIIG